MALALYRKYRPRTFAEVIGQEHVTEPLSQALRSGRLNHAYLFSGPRGCGKTSSARILARSLNCERGPTPEPCGECQSCRDLAPDGAGSIDVIEIDAASHGGVDDARDLRERAFFAPVSSRFKVYVIDEAHMVSSAGFNALLKLVEEPPDYVKFVFATTEPEKVLGTIKSRTHHYPFRLIPPGVLRPYLEQLTVAEGVKVEPAVFPLVVRAGAGSARDSLSVLDQLIAGAGPDGVTYNRAVALLGVTDVALIDEMCDALAADDGRGAYGVIDRVVEAGHDPRRFASDLLERLRDLIVLQQVPDAVAKGLLDAPHDQLERMGAQATQLGQATLSRFADIVHNGLTEMRGTTAPRLLLELVTARMLLPAADDSSGALLQRLERMERRLMAGGVPPASSASSASPASPSAAGAAQPTGSGPGSGRAAARAVAGGASGAGAADARGGPTGPGAETHGRPGGSAADVRAGVGTVDARAGVGAQGADYAGQSGDADEQDQASWGHRAPAGGPSVGGSATPEPNGAGAAPQSAATAPAEATPIAAPVPEAEPAPIGGLDAAAVRRVWADVISLVNDKSKKAAAIVREATVQDVEGNTLVLGFRYVTHANMLNASPEVLLGALQELLGGRWQVRCEVGGGPPGGGGGNRPATPKPTPQPPSPSAPVSSPSASASPVSAPSASSSVSSVSSSAGSSAVSAQVPRQAAEEWPTPASPGGVAAQATTEAAALTAAQRSGTQASPGGGSAAVAALPTSATPGGVAVQVGPVEAWPTPATPGGPAVQAGPVEDWPTLATPGGVAVQAGAVEVWPTPATPGGVAAGGGFGAGLGTPGMMAADVAAAGGSASVATSGGSVVGGSAVGGSAVGGSVVGGSVVGGSTNGRAAGGSAVGGSAAGGSAVGGSAAGGNAAGAGPSGWAAGSVATPGGSVAGGAGPRQSGRSAVERAREAARAAAGQRRPAQAAAQATTRVTHASAQAMAPAAESAWNGAAADEPPFDPEYDGPVSDPRFPGLDPGDELLDDADAVRETSEEAALRLLSEALGAEKIGETTG